MLGKLLNQRYQVRQVLGGGGFGHTYIAQDIYRPGHPKCVVKQFKPTTSNPDFLKTARRLFNSEAETLEKLGKHNQIPQLLAYFEENQEFFLVQELIEGHTLEQQMLTSQRWRKDQVILLLQQVLDILVFVHSHNIIHRDIKPNNIIRRQQDGKYVLIDFGAVKQIQTQLTVPKQISTTIIIGTPGYMPVEQGRGKPNFSSDIYSLGIIGIHALAGLHPHSRLPEDPNTGEILWQHLAHISPELAVILSKMVRYNFKERYQSAIEVLQALEQLNIEGKQSTQPQVPYEQMLPASISQQNTTTISPTERDSPSFVLSTQQHQLLEKILTELVGPVATKLLSQVVVEAPSFQELVENLALYLTSNQQTDFKQRVTLLFGKSTALKSHSANLSSNDSFVRQCERDLIDLIGPIAPVLIQKVLRSNPQISHLELVKILALEIPDPQKALQFQQRLL